MTEILSAVSPSVFSWSMLGRGSSAAFLLPRPEKGVLWLTPYRTFPVRVAVVALMLTGLVDISSNVVQEGHVKAPVILWNCWNPWSISNPPKDSSAATHDGKEWKLKMNEWTKCWQLVYHVICTKLQKFNYIIVAKYPSDGFKKHCCACKKAQYCLWTFLCLPVHCSKWLQCIKVHYVHT